MHTKKKKKAEKVRRWFDMEKEINQRVWGGERQSDMEVELKLEEPSEMGDNASASEDKGDRGAAMTLVERHEPTATPSAAGMVWRCTASFLSQGSVP